MTVFDDHGRPEPPEAGSEVDTLLGFLEYQRATFAWKCDGLDAAGLAHTVGASSMTLGGMLKHLAVVEDGWFTESLFGDATMPAFAGIDWKADPDWEWRTAADDSPEYLRSLWREAVEISRARASRALAEGGLDRLATKAWDDGRTPSLRWIMVHMIEEYARHNGHADLLREAVDASTGE